MLVKREGADLADKYIHTKKVTYHTTKTQFYQDWFKHGMTKYQLDELFDTIDLDDDGFLSLNEYTTFNTTFVDPFKKECDVNNDWLVGPAELKKCLTKSTWFSYFTPNGLKSKALSGFG